MSEAEFDSYLSLLSKFLRLRSRQRAELADELRDHLDSRLDELLSQGKSREQAIQIALEEFGDAAVLAEDFSRLASRRKRRFVMRCTAASAAVVAAVVLLSVAFAPPGPNGMGPQKVVAQSDEENADVHEEAAEAAHDVPATAHGSNESSIEQEAIAELDRKLAKVIPEVKFAETPLTDVLTFVADAIEADTLIDAVAIEDEGLTADVPVTLSLTRTRFSARTVLDFVLQPLNLTFVNRSGVIYVTTEARADEHLTTKVYNVRDLLENAESHYTTSGGNGGGGLGGMGGGGFFAIPDAAAAGVLMSSTSQMGGMGGGMGGLGGGLGRQLDGPALDLIQAIQESTSGAWYDRDSTGGHLSLFNGLLVVRQTDEVHTQVQKLLDALREAGNAQPGGSVTVPKERKSPSTSTAVPAAESTLSVKPSQTKKRVWFSMGVTTSLVSGPAWVEKSGKVRSQPVGLKIEDLDDDGLAASAGFRVGDIVLSWSADKWSRNSTDNNLIASGGAAYTMPGAAEFDSAAGHGTTAIIFAVTRADESGVQRYRGVTLPLGTEHTRRAVVESLLGLQTVQVNERELKQLGDFQTLKDHSGEIAKVVEVKPGGPAAAAGIRQGDMITAVNIVGASVPTPPSSIADALSRHARSFKLSLLRPKGESYQAFVALMQGAEGGLKEIGSETERLSAWRILGIKLEPAAGLEGLTISEIRADGPAADAWFLQPGDVLVGLGKWNVHDGEQLKAALENIKEWDAVEVLTVRGDETLMGTMSIKNK